MDMLLVNIPADLGKKPYDLAFPFVKKMNFGLLAIATIMLNRGYTVTIFDPQTLPDGDVVEALLRTIEQVSPRIIGMSCISGFSYPYCKTLANIIRQHFKQIKIIVGGKDHVGQIGREMLVECPEVDIVVRGEAENTICRIIDTIKSNKSLSDIPNLAFRDENDLICFTDYDLKSDSPHIPLLDYNLYPEYRVFSPSLEVSRGCTFGCEFCVSARTSIRKKEVSYIIDEAEYIAKMYQDNEIYIYLETPIFLMRDEEILQFASIRSEKHLSFTWRTETRVDYLTSTRLQMLADAGLRVVDVGLESASPEILLRMGKTRNPDTYLNKATDLLRTAYNLGIIVKLNILFYIGETSETIGATLSFLEQNLPYVNSLSAYPLLLYPGSSLEANFAEELYKYGGSTVTDDHWKDRHLWPVNPSREFTYDDLQEIGLLFAKSFQTMEVFYSQKRYGYFSPDVPYSKFSEYAMQYGIDRLPFSKNLEEAAAFRRQLWSRLKRS